MVKVDSYLSSKGSFQKIYSPRVTSVIYNDCLKIQPAYDQLIFQKDYVMDLPSSQNLTFIGFKTGNQIIYPSDFCNLGISIM